MIRNKTGHLSVRSGKRVIIHFIDGKKVIAKFKEKRHSYIEFWDYENVPIAQIRTLTIYKGQL